MRKLLAIEETGCALLGAVGGLLMGITFSARSAGLVVAWGVWGAVVGGAIGAVLRRVMQALRSIELKSREGVSEKPLK